MAKKQKEKKPHRKLWLFIKIQMVLILLFIGAITYYYVGGYANKLNAMRTEATKLVNDSKEATFRSTQTSVAYDINNEVLSVMKGEKDLYYLPYNEIPIYAKEAIVSIEDKKYYQHSGVDYRAIIRAAWAMVRNGKVTQGGSTITQQLARNVFLTQDKTWERKIEEIYIAINLEKRYSKQQLLEFYMNNIYFSNGYYGIEAAARGYFSRGAAELSLSQLAFLCGIPNSPGQFDPLSNMSNTIGRRNLILRNMYDDGIISLMEYQSALNEIITIDQTKVAKHNYEETYTYYCATRALMQAEGFEFRNEFSNEQDEEKYKKEYDELYNECNSRLYTGGYRIYTSLDLNMQQMLQQSIDDGLAEFPETSEEGIFALQGAGVCIDNETGFVRAIVGGRSQNYEGYTLNRAYQSFRQPGSSIKPLVVYTPALESGYSPDSILEDSQIPDGPSNADGRFLGRISLRKAVELSRNTVAYKLLEEISPDKGLSYLRAMGFSRLDKKDMNPHIALGGFTQGVSPLEMATGFATIENNGFYREATCILKITDYNGEVIYQPNRIRAVVYDNNAAWQMTDILQGVIKSGTGRGLDIPNMPCAGKTGTTNDNKDGWFVGYTPYYTCSMWVGYDTPREVPGLTGSSYPGHIWQSFMKKVHAGLPYKEFSKEITLSDDGNVIDESITMPITPPIPEITEDEEETLIIEEELVPEIDDAHPEDAFEIFE